MLPVAVNFPVAGLYSSAGPPPAISTWPLFSKVALCPALAPTMLPVGVNFPVAGLYSSALARRLKFASSPPAMSTWPLGSRVADGSSVPATPERPWCMLPVTDQVPVAGLYSSALDRAKVPDWELPPATSTWPFCSSVAVELRRGVFIWPVTAQVPVAGLYSSGVGSAGAPPPELSPVSSTWPFCSSVALPSVCEKVMLPVAVNVPEAAASAGAAAARPTPRASAASGTTCNRRDRFIDVPPSPFNPSLEGRSRSSNGEIPTFAFLRVRPPARQPASSADCALDDARGLAHP